MDLFERNDPPSRPARPPAPLAERLRPRSFEEVLGQDDLAGPGAALRTAVERDEVASMILWGPPGSGKTTLARLVAEKTRARFVAFSAVLSGIKEVKEVMATAQRGDGAGGGRRTLLFVDEIHRFNRAQQDAFLPAVEQGAIVLIGATTENPSFAINAALLSRCSVFVLKPLGEADLVRLLRRALDDPQGLAGHRLEVQEEVLRALASRSAGDARRALNALETVALLASGGGGDREEGERRGGPVAVTLCYVERALQRSALRYDRTGDEHFNLISALQKSLRNGDADAALYWLARMLESGEDPLYIARRMIRFASEDVGNADPGALRLALLAREAFESLGMPEGALALAQAAIYLAGAPKSDSVLKAYERVLADLSHAGGDPVPPALCNAPTSLMKDLGYGREYRSAHDSEDGTVDLDCLPERLRGRRYYEAKPVGQESALAARLQALKAARARQAAARRGGGASTNPSRPRRSPE